MWIYNDEETPLDLDALEFGFVMGDGKINAPPARTWVGSPHCALHPIIRSGTRLRIIRFEGP